MQLSDRIGKRIKLQDLNILMTVAQAGAFAAVPYGREWHGSTDLSMRRHVGD